MRSIAGLAVATGCLGVELQSGLPSAHAMHWLSMRSAVHAEASPLRLFVVRLLGSEHAEDVLCERVVTRALHGFPETSLETCVHRHGVHRLRGGHSPALDRRFRSPTGAAPLVRPDADGEQEGSGEERQAGTRSESGEERRVGGGAGGKSARDMTHKEILAIMESRDRPAGERRGAKGARDRRAYVAKDTYRVVKSQRKPVEGLEAEQESKSVRFTSTGLTFDREGFKKYAKRKQYSQPATLSAKDIRI